MEIWKEVYEKAKDGEEEENREGEKRHRTKKLGMPYDIITHIKSET